MPIRTDAIHLPDGIHSPDEGLHDATSPALLPPPSRGHVRKRFRPSCTCAYTTIHPYPSQKEPGPLRLGA
eukprot:7974593-Pyramimonas_sp.AAC.1